MAAEASAERLIGGESSDEARDAAIEAARAQVERVFGAAKVLMLFEDRTAEVEDRTVRGKDLWGCGRPTADDLSALCEALKVTRCPI